MGTFDLSASEFRALFERVRRMSMWGPDDRRGALNNISEADVVAAASDVWRGRTVSLGAPVESSVAADNPEPCVHQMNGQMSRAHALVPGCCAGQRGPGRCRVSLRTLAAAR